MFEIQPCLEAHLDEVIELNMDVQQLHAEAHPAIFKSDISEAALSAFYKKLLQDENHFIRVAIRDQRVVGYLWAELVERQESLFTYAFRRLKIHHISVAEPVKNRGIGQHLIVSAETLATEVGVSEIVLDVWQFNQDAMTFFEKRGFNVFNVNLWKHH